MASQTEKFLRASGKLQTLAYKYEIERNLRTPDYTGFQLLGLNDYSGQGTALVGVLNVHWREKGYTTAADWTQFCAPIVPLARFPKFVYAATDTLRVPVELYNASSTAIVSQPATYVISNQQDEALAEGFLTDKPLPVGKNIEAGVVSFPLHTVNNASKLTLTVRIGTKAQNSWNFWVYPPVEVRNNATDGSLQIY